jgi:hypothetical integral membrane protein (TIGR02206 family)
VANELVHYAIGFRSRTWLGFLQESLSLHLCGLALYAVAVALVMRKQLVFELACYWGLVATPQAMLTPTVAADFPSYAFLQFFLCHCGIIIGAVFAVGGLKMRPRRRSMWTVFAITNGCLVLIGIFDFLTGANYMFLREAPEIDSPLVAFGWPWHVVIADALMLLGFWIVELLLAPKTAPRETANGSVSR